MNSTSSFDIVAYGREQFTALQQAKLTLSELLADVRQRGIAGNNLCVLYTFCENNLDASLGLYQIQMELDAKDSRELSPDHIPAAARYLYILLGIMAQLDHHFRTDEFTRMGIHTWRETWGTEWGMLASAVHSLPRPDSQEPAFLCLVT